MCVVEEGEEREEEECVAEANQTKEEGHVELQRRTAESGAFQGDGIGAVDDG